MCLRPVTKSAQVTWYKQATGVQPEKVHLLHTPNLEEKCVPTTSQANRAQLEKMHRASTKRKSVSASKIVKGRALVKPRAKRPPTGCRLEATQLALQ